MPKERTEAELWKALQEIDDPLDAQVPSASVDAQLRAAGVDPDALGKEGASLAAKLQESHRLSWQKAAVRKKDAFEGLGQFKVDLAGMSQPEVLERLNALRSDPRFGPQIMTAFRKRKPEESTLDELKALLEDVEALRSLGPDDEDK